MFESIQVPEARKQGWPTSIDWEQLPARVQNLESMLQKVVDDVDEGFLPGQAKLSGQEETDRDEEDSDILLERPRRGSTFWKDVVKNVKQKGSRQTSGVRGQLSSFSKTQPG